MISVARIAAVTALAAGLCVPALAAQRPKWEVGAGALASYSPAYRGSGESDFSGFPVLYFVYRGESFSILPDGLFDIDADDTRRFRFGLSFNVNGSVDSADRLGLGDLDPVIEAGLSASVALLADGKNRLDVKLAARGAWLTGDSLFVQSGFIGFVIEPEISYLVTLTDQARMGFSISAPFATDRKFGEVYYGTFGYNGQSGYLGTDFKIRYVNDLTPRFRLLADVTLSANGGAANADSPLHTEDFGFGARIGFTYALWQSEAMSGR